MIKYHYFASVIIVSEAINAANLSNCSGLMRIITPAFQVFGECIIDVDHGNGSVQQ